MSASPSRWFNALRAGPAHLLICHRHTPSSTTVPERRSCKQGHLLTHLLQSRTQPQQDLQDGHCGAPGLWPGGRGVGVWGGSQAGQQRNSTGALALLVFLGGPCNTISKYKSKSIKGADTLPPSPSSTHLYSHPPPFPRASALGTQKEKSGVGPALGEGPAEQSPPDQALGRGQGGALRPAPSSTFWGNSPRNGAPPGLPQACTPRLCER